MRQKIVRVEPFSEPVKTVATQTENVACLATSDIVSIEVGGQMFRIRRACLASLPGTRLSELTPESPEYQRDTGVYFFDRNPFIFQFLLDAFRLGHIHVPHNYCYQLVRDELQYWRISETMLDCCCFTHLRAVELREKTMMTVAQKLRQNFASMMVDTDNPSQSRWRRWQLNAWYFLEDPNSSGYAKAWGVFFLGIIIVQLANQCLQTLPDCRRHTNRFNLTGITVNNSKLNMYFTTASYEGLKVLDEICVTLFMCEWTLRLIVCPKKKAFVMSFYNILDALAILPLLVEVCLERYLPDDTDIHLITRILFAMSVLGVFRVMRLFKFGRNFVPVKIMFMSLHASVREIVFLLVIISTGMLIFATLIYWAEFYTNGDFDNIPIGLWWSLITMTTVGYGDMYPTSIWGYVIGGICAVVGMLCTGLPIPIIANNFTNYYGFANIHVATTKSRRFLKLKSNVANKLALVTAKSKTLKPEGKDEDYQTSKKFGTDSENYESDLLRRETWDYLENVNKKNQKTKGQPL